MSSVVKSPVTVFQESPDGDIPSVPPYRYIYSYIEMENPPKKIWFLINVFVTCKILALILAWIDIFDGKMNIINPSYGVDDERICTAGSSIIRTQYQAELRLSTSSSLTNLLSSV